MMLKMTSMNHKARITKTGICEELLYGLMVQIMTETLNKETPGLHYGMLGNVWLDTNCRVRSQT